MTRFVVDLGDIQLSPETQALINADLQKTVLAHVADLGVSDPIAFRFPKDWWGLIMRHKFDALKDAEAVLQKTLSTTRAIG